ncbi:hypothetical protein N234_37155 [Ralstonia pickettii DTP0602]|nr:hypothetical protein N234_37155 [Ralstonia pickettii DTP0602]
MGGLALAIYLPTLTPTEPAASSTHVPMARPRSSIHTPTDFALSVFDLYTELSPDLGFTLQVVNERTTTD